MTPGTAPVTVVHVLGKLDRGGVETIALDLCRRIPATDVQQVFLTMADGEGTLAPQFRAAGARVLRCPLRLAPTYPLRLWRLLRTERPHVVVSYVSLVSGLVLTVAALAGVPVRVARMISDSDGKPDTPRRIVQRSLLRAMLRRSATEILGNTTASVAFAAPHGDDRRYRVLADGVNMDRFAGALRSRTGSACPPRLVHIGRAAPEKNRGFLLHVHDEAKRLHKATRLTFVGPGGTADLDAVDPTVRADPLVVLFGETDHVEKVLADCDVLLLPSLREGLPGVVLEALGAGVPVLASDLPGLRELAEQVDGLTLLSLSAGPPTWARTALKLAAMSPSERERLGSNMRDSQFSLEVSAAQWRSLWTGRH